MKNIQKISNITGSSRLIIIFYFSIILFAIESCSIYKEDNTSLLNNLQINDFKRNKLPSPPQMLDFITGDKKVMLFWYRPAATGNSNILEYILYRKFDYESYKVLCYLHPDTTTFIDSNLTNTYEYRYYVRARNKSGKSSNSNEVLAVPISDTIPNTQQNLIYGYSKYNPLIELNFGIEKDFH